MLPLGLAPSAIAVIAPFTQTFQQDEIGASPAGWTTFGLARWAVTESGGIRYLQAVGAAAPGAFAATQPIENLGPGTEGLILSSTFCVNRGTANPDGEYVGLVAFSTQPNLAAASYYVADVQRVSGGMRIISLGAPNPDLESPENGETFGMLDEHTEYTLSLKIFHRGSALVLSLTLSDGVNSKTITANDPTPIDGYLFGCRVNNTAENDPMEVRFTGFSASPLGEIFK